MERIEVNVTTGERKVLPLTPEEIAEVLARRTEEAAKQAAQQTATAMTEQRAAAIESLLIEQAQRADAPQAVKDYAEAIKR